VLPDALRHGLLWQGHIVVIPMSRDGEGWLRDRAGWMADGSLCWHGLCKQTRGRQSPDRVQATALKFPELWLMVSGFWVM
jgi:hypothetical protein